MFSSARSTEFCFDEAWETARPIVHNLLYQKPVTPAEWQDLFYYVYKITSWLDDGATRLLSILQSSIDRYVIEANGRIRIYKTDESILKGYIREWSKFFAQASILPLPFKTVQRHTERSYTTDSREEYIRSLMLEKWNEKIFKHISDQLLEEALRLVKEERDGVIIDQSLVIGVRESFVALGNKSGEDLNMYRATFEKLFIEQSCEYYKKISAKLLDDMGVLDYMVYADQKLEEEQQRAQRYLDSSSMANSKYIDSVVHVIVEQFEEIILAECSKLIAQRDVEKLRLLYRLIRKTRHGIEHVLHCIDSHIKTEGLNDMRSNAEMLATDPEKYVQQLLQMFDKFSSLVREGFCDDARLLTARDKAFRAVVNDSSIFKIELANKKGYSSRPISVESKCAELLANYCDLLLRKTQLSKKLTSDEIDEKLGQVLLVLKYVENKDVFMRFHRAHLSRRLILEMSADQEKEEMMVGRLRESGMPSDSVNKLSRMLQDIEINKDMNVNFKRSLIGTNNNKSIADQLNLKVLNGGAWGRGSSEMIRFSLPRELEDYVPEMEAFYRKQHNGRKLYWMHHWSSGTMVFGTSNGGRFDLECTTFQMAVLFCFNERAHEKISLETLRLATELPDAELNRTLLSLVAYPKMRSQILTCDVASSSICPISIRDFTDSTRFAINHDFHVIKNGKVQNRGKVNLIGRLQLSLEANAEKEHESIVALREFRVQEGLVKILKMRKTTNLAQLTMELMEILKPLFIPSRKLIKEQIDWLIDQNYMTRCEKDKSQFMYTA